MQAFIIRTLKCRGAMAVIMLCMLVVPLTGHAMSTADSMLDSMVLPEDIDAQGIWIDLPLWSLGFEVITEGTNNYTLERELNSFFPLDGDITVLGIFGYTGDKLIIKITDLGDTGDRVFAAALAVYANEMVPAWGTMFSSETQDSFEITVPVSDPGIWVYLLSGYLSPSEGDQPYTYRITLSFPQ